MVELNSYPSAPCAAVEVSLSPKRVKLNLLKWLEYVCADGDDYCLFRAGELKGVEKCGSIF